MGSGRCPDPLPYPAGSPRPHVRAKPPTNADDASTDILQSRLNNIPARLWEPGTRLISGKTVQSILRLWSSCLHTPVRGSDVGFRRRSALPHTSSVQLTSSVWRLGLPLVVVAGSVLLLVSAIRSREKLLPMSRLGAAFLLFVWLRLVGEAAFGDQRPVFERQWKGAAAAFLAMAGAVHLWKRYRERVHDAPEPVATAPNQPAVAVTATPRSSLAVFVTMPALGEDVTQGTVTRWLKQVGDRVEAGEPLVEVSADKVDTEITADASGNLREITVLARRSTPVGTTIAVIEPVDV